MNSTTPSPSPSPLSLGEPSEANGSIIHVTRPGSTKAGVVKSPKIPLDTQHVTGQHITPHHTLPITSTLHNTSNNSSDFGTNFNQHTAIDFHSNERNPLEDTPLGSCDNGTTTINTFPLSSNNGYLCTSVGTELPQNNVQFQSYAQPMFNGNGNLFHPNVFNNETGNNNSSCFDAIPQQAHAGNMTALASPIPQIGFTTGPQYASFQQADFDNYQLPNQLLGIGTDFNNLGYQTPVAISFAQAHLGNPSFYTPSVIPLQYASLETPTYQSPYGNAVSGSGFVNNGFNDNGFNPLFYAGSNTLALQPRTRRTRTQCPNCTVTFSRKSDFDRHHESVHLGIKYHCNFNGCHNNRGKGYCRAEKLKTHQKEMHGVI